MVCAPVRSIIPSLYCAPVRSIIPSLYCAPVRSIIPSLYCAPVRSIIPSLKRGIIDRTGAQTMLYLTCTTITGVDLAHYGVSRDKVWVSVDCGTKGAYAYLYRHNIKFGNSI